MQSPPAQVFISYAHADDQPFDEGTPGWVTDFVDKLQKAVRMKAGDSSIQCWMDHRLEIHKEVNEELRRQISGSRCILAFMSPCYLSSPWCRQEMATFVEQVGGGTADERIFLAEILPTDRDRWHESARNLAGKQFWASSLARPEPKTLGWPLPDLKNKDHYAYWDELNALASILARRIQSLPSEPDALTLGQQQPPAAPLQETKTPATSDTPRILINADKPDRDLGKQVQDLLGELDVDATLAAQPAPGQPPADYRRDLESQLQDHHGVIIVYGQAPASWTQAQYAMARKALAWQRPGVWGALLDGPPPQKPDHGLPTRNLMVLPCRQGLSPEPLRQFVETLRQGAGHV